ncbi:hypothetical protein [Sandaracinus amylolyticus]|uniref:hypothetical protein n=1 Tax=Sandaracinus amylolyticus TaxID=927083 RepID=UPI001F2D35B9|nr:hypothetical protein [Sandaracinus amylolyticus]UJR84202.1 Hypothetical protein I5071_62730 [Sandaracinus amylolyticus]
MIGENDRAYLVDALVSNRAVLFLGAGFSMGATNKAGANIPNGGRLAESLWEFCEFKEPYNGTPLARMYDAALASAKGHDALSRFLDQHLAAADVPNWYDEIAKYYWYRIYTTNFDNVVEVAISEEQRRPQARPADLAQ